MTTLTPSEQSALSKLEAGTHVLVPVRNPENAPKGVPVIVAGGIAMKKTGGDWYSGMEEPLFQRPLQWEPEWWAALSDFALLQASQEDG